MAPSYSDVDEVTGTLQTFQSLSDVENNDDEVSVTQHKWENHGNMQVRALKNSILKNQGFAFQQQAITISDVSDITHSDGEDGYARGCLTTRFSIISSSTTEVNVAKLPTAQSSGRGRFRNVTRRPYRRTIDLSLSSSGVSDVDELVDQRRKVTDKHRRVNNKCSQDAERTKLQPNNPTTITSCNRDCRQCKRRQTRLGKQLSATSTDLGIYTSDIDDDIWKSTHNTPPECSTSDSEMDEADEDTLTGGGMKTKLGRRRSTLYSRMEAHHCRMCCDIDAQTSECEFCGLALCDVCCRLHFSTHAADVKSRLERLRNQAVVSTSKEVRHQLMLEIDKAALDLTIACNTALDRALDVYRATASVSTSFIGSLVDRRIKLSNSLKYLLRQIPRILLSDDVYELMYFVKVAKSVHERMEELKIAIGDPRSKEVFKLVLTNPFSSFAPLFEQNSLLLPLDNCDKLQGHSTAQSESDEIQAVNENVNIPFL